MSKRKFLIIGLGNYGCAMVRALNAQGCEITAIDIDPCKVDSIKNIVTSAMQVDATDEKVYQKIPISSVDAAIVAIGENFAASVKTVANLKKAKVKAIYARAVDDVHKCVLSAFSIDEILTPEDDFANRFAEKNLYGVHTEIFKIDKKFAVIKFQVLDEMIGIDLNIDDSYSQKDFKLVAIEREEKVTNAYGIFYGEDKVKNDLSNNSILMEHDKLVLYGPLENFLDYLHIYRK